MRLHFGLVTALLAGESSTTLFVAGEKKDECSTIAEIACSSPDFSTLCTAVVAAELDGPLNDDVFTVFAPTDAAFANLPVGTVEALLDDVPALTDVLLFHVVGGKKVYSSDLHCRGKVEMGNGDDSRTVCSGDKIYQKGGGNPRDAMPQITSADIDACNGVIHVISEVMLPPSIDFSSSDDTDPPPPPPPSSDDGDDDDKCSTIADIACNTPDFSTLCAAVVAAGLDGALSTGTYTVFAPPNTAFDNLSPGTVDALLDDIPTLTNILLFHVVGEKIVTSSDLHCTETIKMANNDKSRTVCRDDKVYQKGSGNTDDARPEIVSADIKACNGIVHVVSEVMLP